MRIEASGERDIVITREFAAPRRLVFDAHTTPELVRRWLGPHTWQVETAEIDLRVGGAWRYFMRGPGGAEMTLRGTYLEIEAPARLVTTESNQDCYARAEHESVNTMILVERDGRTHLTNTVRFPSRDVRDAVLGTEMERGVAQGFDRLDELLTAGLPRR